jgi:hypothetical protein
MPDVNKKAIKNELGLDELKTEDHGLIAQL